MYIYETTPYGVKEIDGRFQVWQMWWGKSVSDFYDTREQAEQASQEIARNAGALRRIKV
jgi:hypothetical protein